ncbi:hypothetical protein QYE76_052515 [Lolium multiflorum]|uniref:Reverse transcriptase zinc-binding domain-containing protein n=1 Tax=Lolium multiflorum TaxID=4521 RepID=A0AAD8SVI4_LOLMU|nr:hypothetical protein QYE76_052515 [Lolium multiflorum]
MPKELGGLGVKNLKLLYYALRMRWRWLAMTEPDKPWQALKFKIAEEAEEMYMACTKCVLNNGRRLNFWYDRWIEGRSLVHFAPNLVEFVQPAAKSLSVAEALQDDRWVSAIRGAPLIPAIVEFMDTWERLRGINLGDGDDVVTWKLAASGEYSAKSAYNAFFVGRISAPAAKELSSSGAPLMHKLHMWFAVKGRLWTDDRLARRGLEHPSECPLCCQEPETAAHLTVQCSYARQIWYMFLLPRRLHKFTPSPTDNIDTWWSSISEAVPRKDRKELNSLVILTARCLWLERNSRVFDKFASMPLEARECTHRHNAATTSLGDYSFGDTMMTIAKPGQSRVRHGGGKIVFHREVVRDANGESGTNLSFPMLTGGTYTNWAMVMEVNVQATSLWNVIEDDTIPCKDDK